MDAKANLFPIMIHDGSRLREVNRLIRDAGQSFVVIALPWEMIATHEKQAQRNHYQSLTRLAERGGLSAREAVAVLEDRKFDAVKITDVEANGRLIDLVIEWNQSEAQNIIQKTADILDRKYVLDKKDLT